MTSHHIILLSSFNLTNITLWNLGVSCCSAEPLYFEMIPQGCIRENFSKKKIGREEAEECRLSPQPTAHGPAAEHLRPQVGRGLRPEPAHPKRPRARGSGGLADGPNLLKPDTNSVSLGPAWAGPLPRLAAAACGAALAPLRRSHPITDPPSSSWALFTSQNFHQIPLYKKKDSPSHQNSGTYMKY
jgi:hypothetical protein